MSEWRPEGWENPHPQPNGKMHYQPITGLQRLAYENGADAMLAALRAAAGRHHISPSDNDIPCKLPELWLGQTGYVVFIPDEKD